MGETDISNKELLEQLMHAIKEEGKNIKEELKAENKRLLEKLEEQNSEINKLKNKLQDLENRCNWLEKFNRKNNIIIFGLVVPNNISLLELIIQRFAELLDVTIDESDINNIYKLKNEKNSTIKIEFATHLKKELVIRNRYKLKGKKIVIVHDLSYEDRQNQKILNYHLKKARARHYQAKIKENTLIVNGEVYTLEQLQEFEGLEINSNNSETNEEANRKLPNSAPQTPTTQPFSSHEGSSVVNTEELSTSFDPKEDFNVSLSGKNKTNTLKKVTAVTLSTKKGSMSPAGINKEEEKKKLQRTNSTSSTKSDKSDRVTRQFAKNK